MKEVTDLKVFISADLEGVGGYVRWDATDRERERELITGEANAAIAGAFEGGATEVLVTEAHGNMRNIIPEKIDSRATFLSGIPKPLNHMAGIDSTFKAAMFVGYHSKAGTRNGVMSHTYSSIIFSLRFNGVEVGEIGTDAAIAGFFGVPVLMVSGDRAACDEARELLGDVETVAVKEGISRYAARCVPVEEARRLIREGAKRASENFKDVFPFAFKSPVQCEIIFTDPSCADTLGHLPFLERPDGRTVAFTADDFVQAFEIFNALHFLAGHFT